MIGQIIVVAAEVAGGRRGAVLAFLRWIADCGGWSPGWPRRCACRHGGPPHLSRGGLSALGCHPSRPRNEP